MMAEKTCIDMASGNRVEELESRVKELEATVDGLTDELVECKVRIRELENVVDAAGGLDAIEGMAEDDSATQPEPEQAAETTSADAETDEPADTTKSEAPDDADETESESSDIIIA